MAGVKDGCSLDATVGHEIQFPAEDGSDGFAELERFLFEDLLQAEGLFVRLLQGLGKVVDREACGGEGRGRNHLADAAGVSFDLGEEGGVFFAKGSQGGELDCFGV